MKLFLTKERRFWSQNTVLNPVLCISKKGTWKCDVVFTRIIVFALLLTISPLIWISVVNKIDMAFINKRHGYVFGFL